MASASSSVVAAAAAAREIPDCDARCRSKSDAAALVAAISKGTDLQSLAHLAMGGTCSQPGRNTDRQGRTALHMAASVGKRAVAEWLLRFKEAAINAKDQESGYSALHRAVFYGQVHLAEYLLSQGANLSLNDGEGLTPLDHFVRDRRAACGFDLDLSPTNPCDLYAWGSNANFNLGLGHQHQRSMPDVLEYFKKEGVFCRAMTLQKFHSAFLSSAGQVYTCGHGRGGRLGHGSEESHLTPRPVKAFQGQSCKQVALGVDHSVFLLSSGAVWTCGTNTHHQLGQSSSLKQCTSPAPVTAAWKGGKSGSGIGARFPPAEGVAASRFHSLFWTRDALYTWGLNGGQLGHLRGEKTVPAPKLVSSLNEKHISIRLVACSEGAVVVLTEGGEILALHEYQNRRIASRHHDVAKIVVVGGHLDSKVCANLDSSHDVGYGLNKIVERGGQDLRLFVLTNLGKVLVWAENSGSSQLMSCVFSLNREILMSDIAVSKSHIMLLSKEGIGYEASQQKKPPPPERKSSAKKDMTDMEAHVLKNPTESIKLKRIPGIFRGTAVATDPKGQNFCILQLLPNASLTEIPEVERPTMAADMGSFLEEASEMDLLHDVVFRVGGRDFPAHRYIVACSSDLLANRIVALGADERVLDIEEVQPVIFEQMLKYAYTKTCDLLVPGPCKVAFSPPKTSEERDDKKDDKNASNGKEVEFEVEESAFSVREKRSKAKRKKSSCEEPEAKLPAPPNEPNAMTALQDASKLLEFHGLTKALENYRFQDGSIFLRDPKDRPRRPQPCFARKSFPEMCDVTIATEDGDEVSAHRCVLSARLEYFRSMFGLGWTESGKENTELSLPVASKVLKAVLDFLYRDEAPSAVSSCEDPEFIGNVLVVADQLLIPRLIQLCERQLAQLLTLRNAADILQFGHDFACATQIRASASQFICQNLAALLESRSLASLDSDALASLSHYYRQEFVPSAMSKRVVTPYSGGPTITEMEALLERHPSVSEESILEEEMKLALEQRRSSHKTGGGSVKKRYQNRRNSSGDKAAGASAGRRRRRNISSSSLSSTSDSSNSDSESGGGGGGGGSRGSGRSSGSERMRIPSASGNKRGSNFSLEDLDFEEKQQGDLSLDSAFSSVPAPLPPKHGTTDVDFLADFFGASRIVSSPPEAQPGHPSSNTPFSKKFTKKSQKERKKEVLERNSSTEVRPKSPLQSQAPKWGGWGNNSNGKPAAEGVGKTDSAVTPTLSDIIRAQESSSARKQQDSSGGKPKKGQKSSWRQLDLSSAADKGEPTKAVVSNVWKTPPSAVEPSPAAPPSAWQGAAGGGGFRGILDDQSRRSENTRRARSKPLSVTQAEERAIQELAAFYGAGAVFDEHISVVRVNDEPMEAPVWKRL